MLKTEQVKALLMSAAALAADLNGSSSEEAKSQIKHIASEFDAWLDYLQLPTRTREDWKGVPRTIRVGDQIILRGGYWKGHENNPPGSVRTIVSFDSDNDPEFESEDRFGGKVTNVAYGFGEEDSYGWELVQDEEDDE